MTLTTTQAVAAGIITVEQAERQAEEFFQSVVDAAVAELTGDIVRCSNTAGWHPTLHAKQDHHHPPQAWRRLLTPAAWWRVLPLCGICHDEYHTLLNRYIAVNKSVPAGGKPVIPPWAERRTYSGFIRKLVTEAWENRPVERLPYTLTFPTGTPGGEKP